ncbi:glycosyltransferase family 2 protein [Glycomyces sp. NPDC048151]|uniref:glycosyltransferase family 2 protein n=1 Tax=Glycomyces sp. NPDC048151 TaxID=3364002 RepID=UPI00371F1ACF
MSTPLVSVVMPVHNAMPYLLKGLQSVVDQSIGAENLEIIAVDDGSTDGSGEALDKFALDHPDLLRVVHQEASGTPSAPRNLAMDMARGRYIQFLDADDYLGEEALERMVAVAEKHGSDVVLGKLVSVGGRRVAGSMFDRDQPRADLYSSRVYWSLGAWKMYRREMLDQHGLRFRTDRRTGEDRPFVFLSYFHARNISVVAEYDCYYMVQRDDGGNLTLGGMGTPRDRSFNNDSPLEMMVPLVGSTVPAGARRDHLMFRHWEVEGEIEFRIIANDRSRDRQEARLEQLRLLLEEWYSPRGTKHLKAHMHLLYHLARTGTLDEVLLAHEHRDSVPLVGRGGRLYAVLPGREDEAGPGPGPWVDVTDISRPEHWLDGVEAAGTALRLKGSCWFRKIPNDQVELRLELRRRRDGEVKRIPLQHENGRFATELDLDHALGPIDRAKGAWDVELVASVGDFERRAPFGGSLGAPMRGRPVPVHRFEVPRQERRPITVTQYFTAAKGRLALQVGGRRVRQGVGGHSRLRRAIGTRLKPRQRLRRIKRLLRR